MSTEAPMEKATKAPAINRMLSLLLKLGITIVCFWYISTRINFVQALDSLWKADWLFLFPALVFFILSKIFAAFRLNINFRNIGLTISEWKNLRLYWLGMFYNLFLPGAISGDAYKLILLRRRYQASYKKTSAAILLDRFSGVLALVIILSVYSLFVINNRLYQILFFTGALLALGFFYLFVRFVLKDFLPGFRSTFFWGMAVQLCQVVCVYLLLLGLHISLQEHEWIFIFLLSALVSVLPISLGGGLGTREFVFTEGALSFHQDPQLGVTISLLFYLITVIGSAWGVYYTFHDPLVEKKKQ